MPRVIVPLVDVLFLLPVAAAAARASSAGRRS